MNTMQTTPFGSGLYPKSSAHHLQSCTVTTKNSIKILTYIHTHIEMKCYPVNRIGLDGWKQASITEAR